VPGLSLGPAVSRRGQVPKTVRGRAVLGRCRAVLDRDLLEQSVAERLARAAIPAFLLWLAIYWALS
jgi:hypothetical protein